MLKKVISYLYLKLVVRPKFKVGDCIGLKQEQSAYYYFPLSPPTVRIESIRYISNGPYFNMLGGIIPPSKRINRWNYLVRTYDKDSSLLYETIFPELPNLIEVKVADKFFKLEDK